MGFGVLSCFVLVMVSVGRRIGLLEGVALLIWLPIFPVGWLWGGLLWCIVGLWRFLILL